MGFDLDELLEGRFGVHDDEEGVAFLQSWLFFGNLCEALGSHANVIYKWWVEDYDSPDESQKYLWSPYLARYLHIFRRRLSDRKTRPTWGHWDSVYRTTMAIAEKFEARFEAEAVGFNGPGEFGPPKIIWSILTLGQLLSVEAMKSYGIEEAIIEQWPDSTIIDDRLKARHWCPNLVARMKTTFSMDSLYLLSLVPWYNPVNPYTKIDPAMQVAESQGYGRHGQCTFVHCTAEQIDYELYRTAHVIEQCDCKFLGPDMPDIHQRLSDGIIPAFIVKMSLDEIGVMRISLKVVEAESCSGFVAISHVWADGLGNEPENKLPECQLFRISQMVRDLTGRDNQPFWIDTFGIPRDREERKKAIPLISATFKKSQEVLALDGALQHFKSYRALSNAVSGIDVETAEQIRMGIAVDLLLRIVSCSWTTRLWTLPEGQGGRRIHFQFSDGAVELGELYHQLLTWPFVGTSIVQDLQSFLVRLRPQLRSQVVGDRPASDPAFLRWPHGNLVDRFIAMLHAIEFRDSTNVCDQVVCLAVNLNMNVESILLTTQGNRPTKEESQLELQNLLHGLPFVPTDLMFTHGPRMTEYPFRWAPQSLLNYRKHFSFVPAAKPNTTLGQLTERGLRCKLPFFYVKQKGLPDSPFLWIEMLEFPDGKAPESPEDMNLAYYGMMIDSGESTTLKSWRDSPLSNVSPKVDLAFLMGCQAMHGPPAVKQQGIVCLIVVPNKVEGGTVYGTALHTAVAFRLPEPNDTSRVNLWDGLKRSASKFCVN
jgi:hypothetical protein